MAEAYALEIKALAKTYRAGLGRRTKVLSGLSLKVARGEAYGLLGKNGAGKSSTFRILMGLARADSGKIRILDRPTSNREVKMRIGYCPENPRFPANLKVGEILRFHAALVKERILTSRNRITWLLEQFELGDYENQVLKTLSKGTQQRLALALALLARPELLILDEPLTALDPVLRVRIIDFLNEQRRSGMSMLISSHILTELECLCDRLGVLHGGVLQREIDLATGDRSAEMEIRVPFEKCKEIQADEPDLIGIREGDCQCFQGLEFERAQQLMQRWSTAGIPIMSMSMERSRIKESVLAGFGVSENGGDALAEKTGEAERSEAEEELV